MPLGTTLDHRASASALVPVRSITVSRPEFCNSAAECVSVRNRGGLASLLCVAQPNACAVGAIEVHQHETRLIIILIIAALLEIYPAMLSR